MNIDDVYIRTIKDLEQAVEELGFLPYFANSIPGFSIEEHVDPRVWFSGEPGTWEWKGPVINELNCAYGKFFEKKAVYISKDWFPDFANYRRDGYDFDARFEDGLAPYRDKALYDLVASESPVLSKRLKALGNFRKGGNKGFETVITRLQMQTYVVPVNYEYSVRKSGEEFGWGNCRYDIADNYWGKKLCCSAYKREPEESYERIMKQFKKLLPGADENDIKKLIG